jgi:hypothetical protein
MSDPLQELKNDLGQGYFEAKNLGGGCLAFIIIAMFISVILTMLGLN